MKASLGQWVEIGWTALPVGGRADNIPESTGNVPLLARVRGFALDSSEIGGTMRVETLAGRVLQGELMSINPTHTHSFGHVQPELICIGKKLREIMAASEGVV